MDLRTWFDMYSKEVEAIIKTIYNFIKGIFDKEVTPEFDKLV